MAKNENHKGSFWPSYVDIMTTLFAVMLILFAVSYSRFKAQEGRLKGLLKEYEEIIAVYSTVQEIDSTKYFTYNSKYLKHLFSVDVEYIEKEYSMYRLKYDQLNQTAKADSVRDSVLAAGTLIRNKIDAMRKSNLLSENMKFLIVVEGQSSRTKFDVSDWENNYTLSFLRAQHLVKFWKDMKKDSLDFANLPNCELLIAGSGEDGVPRYKPEEGISQAEWVDIEKKNQRFLINIVPVIGNIDEAMKQFKKIKNE